MDDLAGAWLALPMDLRDRVDATLRARRPFPAIKMLCHDAGGPRLRLPFAQDLVAHRSQWLADRGEIEPEPVVTVDELRTRTTAINAKLAAIEAEWRGDTQGWFVTLLAIVERPSHRHPLYDEVDLGPLREGTDLRLFRGQVPPWPEAVTAIEFGSTLAEEFNVPFHFASPGAPSTDQCRWWDTE